MRTGSIAGLCLAAMALAMPMSQAGADSFPSRPITLVVPLAAGGGMDFIARTIGQKLSERLGQPVLVENRPGGGTVVAAVAVAHATPDGYTLLLVPGSTLTTNATVYKKLPYDPRNDFVPIALTSHVAFALVVNPQVPANSVQELIDYARKKPGELIVGTSGIATMTHLASELLKSRTGIDIRHVHYRGSPPAMNDVIAGHVHMMFGDPVTSAELARDQKIRPLGVTSHTRINVFADVPPIADTVLGYEATNWHMLIAPARTPSDVVEKLSAEVRTITALPEVREQILKVGLLPLDSPPPKELKAFLDNDITTWGKLVQDIGLAGSM